MKDVARVPVEPLAFIRSCMRRGRVYWTYHVNMRLPPRAISRAQILDAQDSYEIVEEYPADKYLPSYLLLASAQGRAFHVLVAIDVEGDNIRIVTAYHPDPAQWQPDYRHRRTP